MTVIAPSLSARYRAAFVEAFGGPDTAGDVLPASSTQRRFAVSAESSGRRVLVPYAHSMRAGVLTPEDARARLTALARRHPALRCRVDYDDTGLVVQRVEPDLPPPCAVLDIADPDTERDAVHALLLDAERPPEPCPLRAALLRGPFADRLLLVFDHTVVDETSLGLVTRDLYAEQPLDDYPTRKDYRDAAWHWLDLEVAGAGALNYWVDRLSRVAVADDGATHATGDSAVVVDTEPLPVRDPGVRATMFPRLVTATHQALRACGTDPSTVIYPWGARPREVTDVAGCFMNTVYSGTTGEVDWAELPRTVWRDLDHADVPFDEVVLAVNRRTRCGWSGTAHCLLGFEDVSSRPPLGPPAWGVREWLPPWLAPKCPVNATVRFSGPHLALRVIADTSHLPADRALEFANTWRECAAPHMSR